MGAVDTHHGPRFAGPVTVFTRHSFTSYRSRIGTVTDRFADPFRKTVEVLKKFAEFLPIRGLPRRHFAAVLGDDDGVFLLADVTAFLLLEDGVAVDDVLALRRLKREDIVHGYSVLKEEEGCYVSQKEHTVIVTEDGCEVTTR